MLWILMNISFERPTLPIDNTQRTVDYYVASLAAGICSPAKLTTKRGTELKASRPDYFISQLRNPPMKSSLVM
jgi:hypothetical protein